MDTKQLKALLSNASFNSRGDHIVSDCPFCNKERHFYINVYKAFGKDGRFYRSCWDCKKCGERGNVLKLLAKLGKASLLLDGAEVDLIKKLNTKLIDEQIHEEGIKLDLKDVKLPIGFKRRKQIDYLDRRGFTAFEYDKYVIGQTNLINSLQDYVIVALQEGNRTKGFLSRSMLSKEQVKAINNVYKAEGSKKRYLRYKNSINTEFNKLLLGYDEIMVTTEWVVLVEGYFDKVKVDQALSLDRDDEIKCCSTFGKSISIEQIRKLQRRGISNVILIQDPDAIRDSKRLAYQLKEEFEGVLVGFTGTKDLGDSSYSEIVRVFDTLKKPQEFSLDVVEVKRLTNNGND